MMPDLVTLDKAMGLRPLAAPRILAWLELIRWAAGHFRLPLPLSQLLLLPLQWPAAAIATGVSEA